MVQIKHQMVHTRMARIHCAISVDQHKDAIWVSSITGVQFEWSTARRHQVSTLAPQAHKPTWYCFRTLCFIWFATPMQRFIPYCMFLHGWIWKRTLEPNIGVQSETCLTNDRSYTLAECDGLCNHPATAPHNSMLLYHSYNAMMLYKCMFSGNGAFFRCDPNFVSGLAPTIVPLECLSCFCSA